MVQSLPYTFSDKEPPGVASSEWSGSVSFAIAFLYAHPEMTAEYLGVLVREVIQLPIREAGQGARERDILISSIFGPPSPLSKNIHLTLRQKPGDGTDAPGRWEVVRVVGYEKLSTGGVIQRAWTTFDS